MSKRPYRPSKTTIERRARKISAPVLWDGLGALTKQWWMAEARRQLLAEREKK